MNSTLREFYFWLLSVVHSTPQLSNLVSTKSNLNASSHQKSWQICEKAELKKKKKKKSQASVYDSL